MGSGYQSAFVVWGIIQGFVVVVGHTPASGGVPEVQANWLAKAKQETASKLACKSFSRKSSPRRASSRRRSAGR